MTSPIADEVSIAELDRHVRTIAQWVRLSGTADEAKAFDYIQNELEELGYNVSRHESDALIGYPQSASLNILGDTPTSIVANGYSFSPATPKDGIVGELVFVGGGMPEDYEQLDVRGRIVVSDGLASPGKALAAERAGAIGQIHINAELIHEMCISPVWGTPTPETADLLPGIPAIGISSTDGTALKSRMAHGTVTVRLTTLPFLEWGKIPTLTAELPGIEEDRYVLFSGHVDSWHYGAMDNGTANATQLEVARILAGRRDQLRRGIRLAFWSGHSHCRYAGSAWYADTFWYDLHERCVCHVNVDSVGAIGATVLNEAPTMAETFAFARDVLSQEVNVRLDYKRMGRFSDQSFWGHGIPSVFATFSAQEDAGSATAQAMGQLSGDGPRGGGLGWWWHTTEDTLDKVHPEYFERDARVFAVTLWRLCTDERLPLEYGAVARELADALAQYSASAGGALDLSEVLALAQQLETEIAAVAVDRLDPSVANNLNMDLGRILIPVNYTKSGPFDHDLALRSPAIPGLSEVSLLAKLDPGSSEFQYLRTKLVRERNRVEHALRSALGRVASVDSARA